MPRAKKGRQYRTKKVNFEGRRDHFVVLSYTVVYEIRLVRSSVTNSVL